jgi:hypothetical protein
MVVLVIAEDRANVDVAITPNTDDGGDPVRGIGLS